MSLPASGPVQDLQKWPSLLAQDSIAPFVLLGELTSNERNRLDERVDAIFNKMMELPLERYVPWEIQYAIVTIFNPEADGGLAIVKTVHGVVEPLLFMGLPANPQLNTFRSTLCIQNFRPETMDMETFQRLKKQTMKIANAYAVLISYKLECKITAKNETEQGRTIHARVRTEKLVNLTWRTYINNFFDSTIHPEALRVSMCLC